MGLGRHVAVRTTRALSSRRPLILGYHGVGETAVRGDLSMLQVGAARFRTQLELLLDAGLRFVTMAELVERARGGPLPAGHAVVTFDDGMRDNHATAMPILRELGIPATVYVTVGFIGGPNPWLSPATGERMMVEGELRDLVAAGWEIGAHTMTHPDMSLLSHRECLAEMVESRAVLAEMTGAPVTTFAYPFGRYGPAAVAAARDSGFTAAVTTGSGRWERYELHRGMVGKLDPFAVVLLKLRGWYEPLLRSAPMRGARRASKHLRARMLDRDRAPSAG